ncbi:MAG: DEAD/DEAH box helicase [Chitinophagaceae bacterium]|nr:DEAD/DEAH box helicase [Chitinophagaceae bacterium]
MALFRELGLDEDLLEAVADLGFESPSPIQEKAIPVLLTGVKDFVGLAQTGTGKTAAFGLPLLQLIDGKEKHPQALIVCPTRELCIQIHNDFKDFKKYKKSVFTEAVYGGTSITTQVRNIKNGVQIVAATPGRLIDLIERKAIDLKKVKYVVLDEADEMLNMGFRDDIDFILDNTVNRESIWLFSATMPDDVREISRNYMTKPVEITIGKKNTANINIEHYYFITPAQLRFDALKRLIDFNPDMYGIIFARTKAGTQEVAERLSREGYTIESLHGDLSQQQRDRVMRRFRDKSLQLIVATDVAARGIDVEGITHVINYELPDDPEVYTHRSGRTGRAGKTGICYSICHSRELHRIRSIEKLIRIPIRQMEFPKAEEVIRKKVTHFIDQLLATETDNKKIDKIIDGLSYDGNNLSTEELLKKIVSLQLKTFLDSYLDAPELNIRQHKKEKEGAQKPSDRKRKQSRYSFQRLFINLGTKDGFTRLSLLQFVLNQSKLKNSEIGKIDLRELNSWIEVDTKNAKAMAARINGKKFKGRTLRMNEA